MGVASIQLPAERGLQAFLRDSAAIPDSYSIVCAHDVEKLPDAGNFVAIIAAPGDWEEYIDNAVSRIEFRVATQVAEAGQRSERTALHQEAIGAIHDLLSWGNFDPALAGLNAQQTTADGITIGFSGWEQAGQPPPPTHTEAQIIDTLPYDFIVFIAAAES